MTTLVSYDLNGKKLSFANWISNLSPQETPFTSMTGKESIQQTLFQWQTDSLAPVQINAVKEGAAAVSGKLGSTETKHNLTQILRKVVKVSDTANVTANYGRGREVQYQMEKAGKELKRDIEWAFLNNTHARDEHTQGGTTLPRKTAGFEGLVAGLGAKDLDTGAIVHRLTRTHNTVDEKDIFDMTLNLYMSGSDANVIMFHPKHSTVFSSLQEQHNSSEHRQRIFENTPKFSVYVSELTDPLGQMYKLIPNRWMPTDKIFFFNPKDWTQMVLRAPARTKLAKDGSFEKWMIEAELGLRHRNPFASGIIDTDHKNGPATGDTWATANAVATPSGGAAVTVDLTSDTTSLQAPTGSQLKFDVKVKYKEGSGATAGQVKLPDNTTVTLTTSDRFVLMFNGVESGHWTLTADDISTVSTSTPRDVVQPTNDRTLLMTNNIRPEHYGEYHVEVQKSPDWKPVIRTASVQVMA